MGAGGHERPVGKRLTVDGHTFWRAVRGGRATELTTETGIELDADGCRWVVASPGAKSGQAVVSASREVVRFVADVLSEMEGVARRATVRPVPKPKAKPATPLPPTAPVPCPRCSGEGWPDCELCDGAGVVTRRQAEEWHELHGD
jgi:hypothetical protein